MIFLGVTSDFMFFSWEVLLNITLVLFFHNIRISSFVYRIYGNERIIHWRIYYVCMCHSVSFSASEVATIQNLTISCNSICIIKISAVFLVSTYKNIEMYLLMCYSSHSQGIIGFLSREISCPKCQEFSCYFKIFFCFLKQSL